MNREQRELLKQQIDIAARERADRGYMDCDPESLTQHAIKAEEAGFPEVAEAFRNFRDKVVNTLLGEGWSLEKIERTMLRHIEKRGKL